MYRKNREVTGYLFTISMDTPMDELKKQLVQFEKVMEMEYLKKNKKIGKKVEMIAKNRRTGAPWNR